MEWLKKLLEGKGLSEEQIKAIIDGVEENYKGFVPKHRFDEVNDAKKQLEADIKVRDNQLDELKKSAGESAALQEQITKLQADNKTKDDEYQTKIKDMAVTTAIKLALAADAHDPDLVAGLVDRTKLILGDDGKVTGLDDQLKVLRESKAFLFVEKDGKPQFRGAKPPEGGGGSGGGGQKNPWAKETFNLTEQGRILREDPKLAEQLKAAAK